MTPKLWQQVVDSWDRYFDLPEPDRPMYLKQLHADNAEVAGELEALICEDSALKTDQLNSPHVSVLNAVVCLREVTVDQTKNTDAVNSFSTCAGEPGDTPNPSEKVSGTQDSMPILATEQHPNDSGMLGEFRILEQLGQGGMGMVFLAEDTKLQRHVAIKTMRPEMSLSPTARERFLREARTLASVEHEHVVVIHYVGEENGAPYLVTPLLKGESLEDRLKRTPKLSATEVQRIGCEAAKGLAACHQAGLVHRDIKPGNIWLEGEREKVKLLDFGLARTAEPSEQLTHTGAILGTPSYMSPEQASGHDVDDRSDLFSLGCVMYQMITGINAFQGRDMMATLSKLAVHEPDAPHLVNPDCPQPLSGLVMKMLAKKPADRPENAQQVIDSLINLSNVPNTGSLEQSFTQTWTRPPNSELVGKATPPQKSGSGIRYLVLLGIAVAALGALFAQIMVTLRTEKGTLVVTVPESGVKVFVDGKEKIRLESETFGKVELLPGNHEMIVKRGKEKLFTKHFKLERGGRKVIEATWGKNVEQIPPVPFVPKVPVPVPPVASTFTNSLGMKFVLVPKGKFWMGRFTDNADCKNGVKQVEMPNDFFMGIHEVTQGQWQALMGNNPSFYSRTGRYKDKVKDVSDEDLKQFPVEGVSWEDAQLFIQKLNKQEQGQGRVYRLPTNEEWEYACRGGGSLPYERYLCDYYLNQPSNTILPNQANFDENVGRPTKVGSYRSNALGIYDMHGNVLEVTHGEFVSAKSLQAEPGYRAFRGGNFHFNNRYCRAAHRVKGRQTDRSRSSGFRLVCYPGPKITQRPNPIDLGTFSLSGGAKMDDTGTLILDGMKGTAVRIWETDNRELDGFKAMTIEAWVYPERNDATRAIVSKYDSRVPNGVSYSLIISDGKLKAQIQWTSQARISVNDQGPDIPSRQWTHVALIWSGEFDERYDLKLFVNGKFRPAKFTKTGTPQKMASNNVPVNIGSIEATGEGGPTCLFQGKIKGVHLYDRALSPSLLHCNPGER